MRGTELRKQFATTVPIFNEVKDSEVADIANYMGHSRKIHDEHYNIPVATRDIVRMSRFLEKGCGGVNTGKHLYSNMYRIDGNTTDRNEKNHALHETF